MSRITDALAAAPDVLPKIGQALFAIGFLMIVVGVSGLLMLLPYLAARAVLQWTQATLPTALHALVLSVFFVILGFWAWVISGDRGNRVLRFLYTQGIAWPCLFSIALLLFAILCFASLSSTLNDLRFVAFKPAIGRGEFWRFQDFYSWHFLDAIPSLKVPQTIGWTQPYESTDRFSGVLLLAFKLMVIVPVIGSFSVWNRIRKEPRLASGTPQATREAAHSPLR